MFWQNRSLIYPSVALLLCGISITLAIGFFINYSILEDHIRQEVVEENLKLTKDIHTLIQKQADPLIEFKHSWLDSKKVTEQITQDGQVFLRGLPISKKDWQKLKEIFPLWPIDLLVVTDTHQKPQHIFPESIAQLQSKGDFLTPEYLKKIQQKLPQKAHLITLKKIGAQWAVLLFLQEQLQSDKQRLTIFGRWLNQPPATQMQKIEQAAFMLTTTDALVLNNLNEAQAALRSQKRIDTTLTEEQYQFDFDISQSWGLFYTPLTLFDSKLCLILP
ncbi:hypothetical protein ACQZV8_19695, partial [Magnetococcales bacterium HHB-1]